MNDMMPHNRLWSLEEEFVDMRRLGTFRPGLEAGLRQCHEASLTFFFWDQGYFGLSKSNLVCQEGLILKKKKVIRLQSGPKFLLHVHDEILRENYLREKILRLYLFLMSQL